MVGMRSDSDRNPPISFFFLHSFTVAGRVQSANQKRLLGEFKKETTRSSNRPTRVSHPRNAPLRILCPGLNGVCTPYAGKLESKTSDDRKAIKSQGRGPGPRSQTSRPYQKQVGDRRVFENRYLYPSRSILVPYHRPGHARSRDQKHSAIPS